MNKRNKITEKYFPLDCLGVIISFLVYKFEDFLNIILLSKTINFYVTKNLHYLIKNLNCSKSQITDKGISYLKGIHTLDISWCDQITDKGISYFKRIHTLDISYCFQITDKGISYLKGIHTLVK